MLNERQIQKYSMAPPKKSSICIQRKSEVDLMKTKKSFWKHSALIFTNIGYMVGLKNNSKNYQKVGIFLFDFTVFSSSLQNAWAWKLAFIRITMKSNRNPIHHSTRNFMLSSNFELKNCVGRNLPIFVLGSHVLT